MSNYAENCRKEFEAFCSKLREKDNEVFYAKPSIRNFVLSTHFICSECGSVSQVDPNDLIATCSKCGLLHFKVVSKTLY